MTFLSLTQFVGCISLSKMETSHINVDSKSYSANMNVTIYLLTRPINRCILNHQRQSILASIHRYFDVTDKDKVTVYIEEKFNVDTLQGLVNAFVSVATYTVIPMYTSLTYFIDVGVQRGNVTRYKSFAVNHSGIGSILVFPFYLYRSDKEVRRNNIENGFYRASLEEFKDTWHSSKYIDLKPTEECIGWRASETDSQQW